MVEYEFDMFERFFLENSVFLDIPVKFLLLAKCQCLVMYSLKIILRNVQRMDITSKYVDAVIIKEEGKAAMELASRVHLSPHFFEKIDIENLPFFWV